MTYNYEIVVGIDQPKPIVPLSMGRAFGDNSVVCNKRLRNNESSLKQYGRNCDSETVRKGKRDSWDMSYNHYAH